jgi:hypothetical protein
VSQRPSPCSWSWSCAGDAAWSHSTSDTSLACASSMVRAGCLPLFSPSG